MKTASKADIILPPRPNPQFSSIKEFSLGEELGEGAIASVFLATHTPSGKKYAVKDVEISTLSEQDFENVEKEIEIHCTLDHPYIIKMHDFFKENGHVYIVLNLAQNGNLFKFLTKNNPLKPEDIGRFWTQTAKAIQYLHSKQILMRDLKPENLLLDENMNIKVCDFGWATRMDDFEYKKLQGGTFAYMSPETLEGKEQGPKSDVWSLGILLFELYHNREPFTPGDNCEEQLYFLKIGRVVYKMGLDMIVSNLIEKLLKKDHTKRIGLDAMFNDPFTIPYVKNLQSANVLSQAKLQPQNSLQNQRSRQNSQVSFGNKQTHLQKNLLSYQNTFKSMNEKNPSTQALVQNKSSTSISNSRSIGSTHSGLHSQNQRQGNVPKSYTYTPNVRVSQQNQPRLMNQTSMMPKTHYHPVTKNFSRKNLSNQVSFQEKKVEVPAPAPVITKQKSVKDIISYYQNKTPQNAPQQVKRTEIKTKNSSKKMPVTRSFTSYQNGNNYSSKPQGVIQFGNKNPAREVHTTHQYLNSQNTISRKPVYKPTRILHQKTNSVDVQSLQNTFGNGRNHRMTQPIQKETKIQETRQITRKVEPNRAKSKNRKINLDKYNVMRASKMIPNYTKSNLNSYKAFNQNPSQKLSVPFSRGMTKNRSYNDLQAYKIKLAQEPGKSLVNNNYSQKFTKSGTQKISRKPATLNEYGISNSRMQVNRSKHIGLKKNGARKQRSVRKINLSNYHRSFNLLK